MNNLKKFFALMLCLALMITCFAGCHKKGEIAVKIGDIEFTSGYYACALVNADTEARAKVEEGLSEDELKGEIKYWKHQVEKTDQYGVSYPRRRCILVTSLSFFSRTPAKGISLMMRSGSMPESCRARIQSTSSEVLGFFSTSLRLRTQ